MSFQVIIAEKAGFCFGVTRAIKISYDLAKKGRGGVYTFGPIIHNPQVIESLKTEGVVPVDSMDDLKKKDANAVIIRTHGIPLQIMEQLGSGGAEIVDATCPFVKKAQNYARNLFEEGYQVLILGDANHPEVEGLVSYAGSDAVVVNSEGGIPKLKIRVGVVVQTTQPVQALKKLLSRVVDQAKEIKVYNTICNSTALRLKETEDIAKAVDVMVIVGGRNSANTSQLANLCLSLSVSTQHIETASEIQASWFQGAKRVGITAGASTPDWIIDDVIESIKDIGGRRDYGN